MSDSRKLNCAVDLARTEATGAGIHSARGTVNDSLNALNVGLPGTVGTSV